MTKSATLVENIQLHFGEQIQLIEVKHGEVTLECSKIHLKTILMQLKTAEAFQFNQLIDLCGVDYLDYGLSEWETTSSTEHGFSRGVEPRKTPVYQRDLPRFAVVYHCLSLPLNHRIRIRVFLEEADLILPSVVDIWKSANWFEREAYDLYGILFEGHPDLRRILTDYGFIGHPFRKDFPLSGHVEMRYDATLQKVIYEPVQIEPRVIIPKVIRDDNRYLLDESKND